MEFPTEKPTGKSAEKAPSRERRLAVMRLAAGILLIGAVFAWLQFSLPAICCGDFDGYYHAKWSRLLWDGLRHGHFPAFTWLPLTTLNPSRYADQHFLFHLLLIPFTWFSDLRLGAKLATVLFSTAAVFSLYWLIVRERIRYSLLWLLALLGCSWLFLARLSMTKAQGLSILFIVAGIYLLFERKYTWLGLAAFLYVWTYNLFVMLGVLALIWVAVLWWSERRLEWRPLLWTGVGMLLGFVVSPYFPQNISLFLEHVVAKSSQASPQARVGFEWYSLPSWDFLTSSLVACAAMVVGYIAFGRALSFAKADKARLQRPLLFFMFSSFLLLITIRSVRFMEYWPPFAVLFAAFTMQAVWNGKPEEAAPLPAKTDGRAPWGLITAVAVLLLAVLLYNLHATRVRITSVTKDPDHYRAGAAWMRQNIPPGALIYDVNWSDFPKLFFYDPEFSYVSGLDPLYLLDQHPELARLNDRLSSREEPDPAAAIRSLFAASVPSGVSLVFVGDDPAPPPPEWFQYIMKSGKFKQLYQDSECVILQVLNRGEAPQSAAANPAPAVNQSQPTPAVTVPPRPSHIEDTPTQRKFVADHVSRRFGGNIYGTVDENYAGDPGAPVPKGPALIIHNSNANLEWVRNLFRQDGGSATDEALWEAGFRYYLVTDGTQTWGMRINGNPKYRGQFGGTPSPNR